MRAPLERHRKRPVLRGFATQIRCILTKRYCRHIPIQFQAISARPPNLPAGGVRALAPAAALFHSLSDPARLAVLQHLICGEHRVRDLTEHIGLAQGTVSAHLACLKDCGLVDSRPQGRASVFVLTTAPELLAVLAAAEQLLDATGHAVELCPTYGLRRAGGQTSMTTGTTTHEESTR